jgi:hypothetical protein
MRRVPAACLVAALAACGSTYTPAVSGDIRTGAPPTLAPREPVSLVNGQPEGAAMDIGRDGDFINTAVSADLHGWTAVVIGYARSLLDTRSATPSGATRKWLNLRIVDAHFRKGAYVSLLPVSRPGCQVALEVATSGGYRTTLQLEERNLYDSWQSACENVTRQLAAALFQDPQILRYLNE